MRTDDLGRDVWTDLVGGLIDARADPAKAREKPDISAIFADHARTVLPVALGALDAARREAQEDVEVAAATLEAATAVRAAAAEPADDIVVQERLDDVHLLRRASTLEHTRPSTLEDDRPRQLVAGLVSALEHPTRSI